MTIRIVTDSACDVPTEIAQRLNITVIPVYINIGEDSYLDGIDLTHEEFFTKLPGFPVVPTTAAPAPGSFTAVYQQLADEGADEILSIHISAELSATYHSAVLGAQDVEDATVTHFNTRQITLGSGLMAIIAAEAAAVGHSIDEIVAMLTARLDKTRIYASIATLEFMRRSGRVNWAAFGFGTLLQIKPVVTVYQSEILVAERVRTFKRSVARMVELIQAASPLERIAILHAGNREAAESLASAVADLCPTDHKIIIMELGPAIGTHVGPGSVGVAFIQAS